MRSPSAAAARTEAARCHGIRPYAAQVPQATTNSTSRMLVMGLLGVNTDELGVLAAESDSMAGQLVGLAAPAGIGSAVQATSAAVSAVHSDAAVITSMAVARVHATASKLASAGTVYNDRDASAAEDLHIAGQALEA